MVELSATTLEQFVECSRCFWLNVVAGIDRPRRGFPSAMGSFDRAIKAHADAYRDWGRTPPMLRDASVEVSLYPDSVLVDACRSWQTAPQYVDEERDATLVGAMDDLLEAPNGDLVVFDYKTRASLPSVPHGHYRRQLAIYTLLLREADYNTADYGVLCYLIPAGVDAAGSLRVETALRRVPVAVEAVRGLFERAATVAHGPIPPPDPDCAFCDWARQNADRETFDP